ncbi:hypothetical protein [Sediminibacillus massiliensis]|uniref:hypothetical protein n=1 Tax=Sediminibacillus massiliensis TaxID=1926277 RepID=UPI0009887521|nr:hypothetical protein [Sediminibacillus massiliensis]
MASKTIHYCDVCDKETQDNNLFHAKMKIEQGAKDFVYCTLDVCEECLEETGFVASHGNSSNNSRRTERGFGIWSKWFKKGKRVKS